MDLDGEVPELRALASYAAGRGGQVWAAEAGGAVVGMVCTWPLADGVWEIGKMYVARPHRGAGLAGRLLAGAEAHARAQGATRLALWSDTRFDTAHRFYEKHSFIRQGGIRVLDDISHSLEFPYAKPLAGVVVQALDAAAAASAEARLADILVACVADGASVSFLPPLAPATARGFWRGQAKQVATGGRILLGAWVDGVLAGTVGIALADQPNGAHRAEVTKLLVHPAARRRGAARALMLAAEAAARDAGRRLLVLDTRADDHGEALYRSLGWIEAGRIPGYALEPDGGTCATVIFYRTLE